MFVKTIVKILELLLKKLIKINFKCNIYFTKIISEFVYLVKLHGEENTREPRRTCVNST